MWYMYLIIGIFLVFSLFFSSADMALSVVDSDTLQDKAEKTKKKRDRWSFKVAADYEFSISAILFGNNLANIGASSFAVILGRSVDPNNGTWMATLILTVVIIVFCEFIPKAFTKRFAYGVWNFQAPIIYFFEIIFFPFVWPVSKLFKFLNRPLQKKKDEEDEIDDDVLQEMVDTIEDEGLIEKNEAELVRSTIDLADIEAYEIMTPRVDTFMIDIDESIDELLKKPELYDFSRIPVYEETVDQIVGILPVKSLLKTVLKKEPIDIRKLMYKPLFIPRNTLVLDLLNEFKKAGIHIAVIKDEYGGTEGVVTMEDILELIVGDIFDENDEIEEEVEDQGNGTFLVDGAMNIEDMFELIGYKGDFDTAYTTVGGFCQEFVDGFGKVGDTFAFAHYRFSVVEADEFSIEKVKIVRLTEEEEEELEDEDD